MLLLAGCLLPLGLAQFPSSIWALASAALVLLCALSRTLRPLSWVLLGSLLMWQAAQGVLSSRLDPGLAGTDLRGRFRIVDFPTLSGATARLLVTPDDRDDLPARMRLSWYDPIDVPRLGECWSLELRLRRPRGFANPHGFDYEGWLFRTRIGATGYVRRALAKVDCDSDAPLARLRDRLDQRIAALLPPGDAAAALAAITVGARHRISRDQWDRYAVTGTSHLMAISGMHVGLAAAVAFVAFRLAFGSSGDRNARDSAACAAVFCAGAYVVISGFAVPARRALGMLLLVWHAMQRRRRQAPLHVLGVVAAALAVADPLATLAPGYQLSFAAVAILIVTGAQYSPAAGAVDGLVGRTWLGARELPRLQVALLFGLLPLTALHFGRISWLGPAVNLVAVPVFNLITVPTALLGLAMDGPLTFAGNALLRFAWYSMNGVLALVRGAAALPGADVAIAASGGAAAVTPWLALAWVLLPPGWPGRRVAWIAAAATVLHVAPAVPPGCADLRILDVGQGLAVIVRTHAHTLVYDAGPSFRTGGSTGQLVVRPYLQSLGIRRLDMLVVSHADADHAGGVSAVAASVAIDAVLVGEPLKDLSAQQHACRAGQAWQWDEVRFTVLHPAAPALQDGNNASCVLEIRVGEQVALLTGDIERVAERALLRSGLLGRADLVVVPHHGSGSSSHPEFVDAVGASVAVVSAGFANQWSLPRADVVERWGASGARVLNTAIDGAIGYRLCRETGMISRGYERRDRRRIWTER